MVLNATLETLEKKNPELAILVIHEGTVCSFSEEIIECGEGKDVLYCLGVSAVRSVYKQHRQKPLVFLEYRLSVYRALLEQPWILKILEDPQVHFIFCPEDSMEKVLDKITWNFVARDMDVVVAPNFDTSYAKRIREFLLWLSAYRRYLVRGDLEYNWVFFRNFYKNIFSLKFAREAAGCFQQFKGIPAIICAAGPSLHKQFNVLHTLKNRALLFAGGSAVNALRAVNIRPHFALGLDPSPEEYSRFYTNDAFEIPFIYRFRLLPEALELIHAPRLYVAAPGWYPIESCFEEHFNITPSLIDEGLSVSCFSTEVAAHLGCNPIIWIGTDLAYTGGEHYSPGVLSGKRSLPQIDHDWFGSVETEDAKQRPILSRYRFLVEARNLTMTAERYPSQLFINATEGGIEIPRVRHETLTVVTEKYCNRSYDLKNRVHTALMLSRNIAVDGQKIRSWLDKLQSSLEACLEIINGLLDQAECYTENLWDTTEGAIALLNLEVEMAFQGILLPLLHMKRRTLQGSRLTSYRRSVEEIFYLQSQVLLQLRLTAIRKVVYD